MLDRNYRPFELVVVKYSGGVFAEEVRARWTLMSEDKVDAVRDRSDDIVF
jgi:hypothetical protein